MLAKCRVLIAVLVTLPALLVSLHAYAQGLGQISLNSAINEPLDARIEIQQLGGLDESQILVSLASEADFERFNIERLPFLQGIQFDVQVNSNNSATIILSTTNPVVEPYISLVLDARWPNGRLIREYTVLLDLPTFTAAPTAPAPQPAVTNPEPEPPVEPASGTASSPAVREPLIPPDNTPEQADPQVSEQQPGQFPESPAGPEEIVPETEPQTAQAADIAEQEAVAEQSSVPDPLPAPEPEVEVQEQTVLTQSNDTLWQIALETRPDEVSVQQMMLALQRANEAAFINNNINSLRTGQVLRIPEIDEILEVNQQQAIAGVAEQNNQYALSRGIDTEPLAINSNDASSGAADPASDELTVLTGGDSDQADSAGEDLDATIAALENELMLSEENLDRARIENQELTSRVQDLEAQVETLQNIIAIEDQRLAQLQAELAAQAEAEAAAAAAQAAQLAPPPVISQPAPQGAMGQLNSLLQNTWVLIGALLTLVMLVLGFLVWRSKRVDETAEDPFPAKAALAGAGMGGIDNELTGAPQDQEGEEDDDEWDDDDDDDEWDDDVAAPASQEDEDSGSLQSFAQEEEGESGEDDTDGLDADELMEDLGIDDFSGFDLDIDEVDEEDGETADEPEQEAEANSETVLDGAGLSAETAAEAAVEEQETDLEAADLEFFDDDPVDDELAENLADIDAAAESAEPAPERDVASPDMDIQEDGGEAEPDAVVPDGSAGDEHTIEFSAEQMPEVEAEKEATELDDDAVLDFSLDEPTAQPDTESPEEPAGVETFEFNLSEPSSPEQSEDAAEEDTAAEGEDEVETFDFKVEDKPAAEEEQAENPEPEEVEALEFEVDDTPSPEQLREDSRQDQDSDTEAESLVEFDFNDGDADSPPEAEDLDGTGSETAEETGVEQNPAPGVAGSAPDSSDDDFDFDITFDEPEADANPGDRENSDADDEILDLGNLDIDEDLLVPDDDEEVDVQPLSDRDEASTKLDLAVAYEAMGDLEGANEILDEVIAEGNDEQVAEAKNLKEQWQQSEGNS